MKRLSLWVAILLVGGCGSTTAGRSNAGGSGNGSGTGASAGSTSSSPVTGGGSGSNTSGAPTTGNAASTGSAAGSSGSTSSDCVPNGSYTGDASLCCSGAVDASGYCAPVDGATGVGGSGSTGSAPTTGGGTNGNTSSTAGGTGTTTGGTCPNNMPNLVTGQGGRGVGPCNTNPGSSACPKGYQCISGECTLNSSSTLQVTLSFDDIEDFDLHLMEPLTDGGYCEIYYGNPGTDPDGGAIPIPPGFGDAGFGFGCQCFPGLGCFGSCDGGFTLPTSGNPCPVGWLDRDSNAACGGEAASSGSVSQGGGGRPDGVNVENILFPRYQAPPSGKYIVRVDYWENCDQTVCSDGMDQNACNGYPTSHLGLQVRTPDSAIWQYCPDISQAGHNDPNDHGDNGASFPDNGGAGSGFFVTSFTVP